MLLLHIIGASKLLFDLQFVKLLAPDIGNMLANVNDENNNLVRDRSPTGPLAALLATYLFLQVSHVTTIHYSLIDWFVAITNSWRAHRSPKTRVETPLVQQCISGPWSPACLVGRISNASRARIIQGGI